MAHKADYFQTSCKGKISYKSPKDAKEVADRMNKENRNLGLIERMEHYRCQFCDNYHVGHELGQEKKIKNGGTNKGRGR